jgi:hypothetical protein
MNCFQDEIQEVLAVFRLLGLFGDCQVFGLFPFDGHRVQKVELDGGTGGTTSVTAGKAI